jgi:hypothetical protein
MLKQEFSEHTFEYGEEERWVKIPFEYLRNFLNNSVKESYQEHD